MTKKYLPRKVTKKIMRWMERPEFIAIKGPRQSGKTTLLKILKSEIEGQVEIVNLEKQNLLGQLEKDPIGFVKSFLSSEEKTYLFLDEYQYVEDGGQKLKLIFDELSERVKVVVTGSSSLELTNALAEFMVGRLLSTHLFPFSFEEYLWAKNNRLHRAYQEKKEIVDSFFENPKKIKKDAFHEEIMGYWEEYSLWGGYPAVVTAEDEDMKKDLLRGLVDTYIEKDIAKLIESEDIGKFKDLVRMLAAGTGRLVNYDQLGSDSGLYFKKLKHYLSILEETYLINKTSPFHKNITTEIKKNPRIYLIDSGLRNLLIDNFSELSYRSDKGQLAEQVAMSQLLYQNRGDVLFWRTSGGAEVDFVSRKGERIYPVEIKYRSMSETKLTKSIHSFIESYKPPHFLVATKDFWGKTKTNGTDAFFFPVCYL